MRWPVVVVILAGCADPGATTRVEVTDFGARGDGLTDDTAAIQAAIDQVASGGTIGIPDGRYRIDVHDGGGLKLHDHQLVELATGATLEVIPNTDTSYNLVQIFGVTDVTLRGGSLVGDRDAHVLLDGEDGHGHGITILSSSSVIVDHVRIADFWGDGVYIGALDAAPQSRDIQITNCVAESNRRQGLSITDATNVLVIANQFLDTHGTAPEVGIDLEPEFDAIVRDIQIVDNAFRANTYGVLIVHTTENVLVSNNELRTNVVAGIQMVGVPSTVLVHRNVIQSNGLGIWCQGSQDNRIEDNLIDFNLRGGIDLEGSSHVAISGNQLLGNGDGTLAFDNLALSAGSTFNVIERNVLRRGDPPAVSRYGIQIATPDCVANTILDNDLSCGGAVASISDLGTSTLVQSNSAGSRCLALDIAPVLRP